MPTFEHIVPPAAHRSFRPSAGFGAALIPAALALLTAGCQCGEERPYTPFAVTTALPSAEPGPEISSGETSAIAPPTTASAGLTAPPDAGTWEVYGRKLVAPKGQFFRAALLVPDEPPRLVAWIEGPRPSAKDGLWLMSDEGKPSSLLFAAPGDLPLGDGCERTPRLSGAGRGVFLRVDVRCAEAVLPGSNVARWAALGFSPVPRVLLELTRVERKRPVSLELSADVRDLDGDTKDDLVLTVSALDDEGKLSREALRFEWLARPAGLSRIAGEPAKTLDTRVGALLLQAVRKAERASVPASVARLRALFAAMCAESGSPEYGTRGGALSCGSLGATYDRVTRASVTAEFGLGHKVRALGEASRLGAIGAGGDAERKALRDLVDKNLSRVSPRIELERQTTLGERPATSPNRVFFDRDGRLFLRRSGGAEAVWPASEAGLGGSGATPAAPIRPTLLERHPGGRTFVGVFASCESTTLDFGLREANGVPLPPFALPIPSPRPLPCLATRPPHLPFALLGYTPTGVLFSAYYEPFGTSPEELSGTSLAYPTPFGLAVARGGDVELWSLDGGAGELECATNEERALAACLRAGTRLTLYRKPPK